MSFFDILSLISLIISIPVGILQILNWNSNRTKLNSYQMTYDYNPLATDLYLNHLMLSKEQDSTIWQISPTFYLFIGLKIENLSFQPITISDFIINGLLKFEKKCFISNKNDSFRIAYFGELELHNSEANIYGDSVFAFNNTFSSENDVLLTPGTRLQAKDVVEGVICICFTGMYCYNAISSGNNVLTIVTPDKAYDIPIEIYKTRIPK